MIAENSWCRFFALKINLKCDKQQAFRICFVRNKENVKKSAKTNMITYNENSYFTQIRQTYPSRIYS